MVFVFETITIKKVRIWVYGLLFLKTVLFIINRELVTLNYNPRKLTMRYKVLLVGVLMQLCFLGHSQNRFSLYVFTGVGNSWFSGNGVSSETDYHTDYLPDMASYANKPYRNKTVFVGQVGVQGKLDIKNKWIVAMNLQYGNDGRRKQNKKHRVAIRHTNYQWRAQKSLLIHY